MLDGQQADTGMAPCQIFNAQRQYGSNGFFIKGFADTGRMAHQNILLELPGVTFGYRNITEGAKTGGNSIYPFLILDPLFNEMPAFLNLFFRIGGQLHLNTFSRNADQICQGHALHTKKNRLHGINLMFADGSPKANSTDDH